MPTVEDVSRHLAGLTQADLKKFAETKHKGLPVKKKRGK